ncbi:MAG: polymer-forming cytoskeletal protein [Gammaproteobacteria bacterium]|nr:polymer-forming cytoskeletal protein [Gammaproteobacteria bacterium]
MFEKSNHQENASTAVQPLPANRTRAIKPADVGQPPLASAPTMNAAPELSPTTATIIASDVVFKGELIAGNDVVIHGTIEGMIARHTKNVIVGKEGRVKALIHASCVKVQGQVDGDIYGDDLVELMDGARVNGNIFCPCIRVEEGARFNGTVSMA